MFRKLFKDKNTGEQFLLWRYFINKEPHYFKDVSLTNEVDISNCDEVVLNYDVVNAKIPYQLFGIECERGWYHLLQPVIDYIDKYNTGKSEDDMIHIMEIKEKYGTLRVYVSHYTPELEKLIDEAEKKSESVCEMCGSEENVGSTLGWYITICHDCIKNRCKERDESVRWRSYNDDVIYLVSPDKDDEFLETVKEYEEDLQ